MKWIAASCVFVRLALAQPASVNVSHDLTALKIAAQNMTPDSRSLDSRPLLEAAVDYAQAHSIPTITADPGSYYFLTGHPNGRYFSFQSLRNLIFDFAGSDLYFAQSNWTGIECDGCNNVQFRNFTLDLMQLPFTQMRVTGVDPSNRRINYAVAGSWETAATFNAIRNPAGSPEPVYAFVFRNGSPLRSTGRMFVTRPIDSAHLIVASDGFAWSDPQQLSSVQAGDVIVVTARSSGAALVARGGTNILISNVAIYSSGGPAVVLDSCVSSTIQRVQVIPRPGTDRLISSNAEGIAAPQPGHDLKIQHSRIRSTGDDGISITSRQIATLSSVLAARQIAVMRSASAAMPNGSAIQVIDRNTGSPAITAKITDQQPPFYPLLPAYQAMLTLDQNVGLPAEGSAVVYGDPSSRGAGLLVENNLIEDVLHSRGVLLSGLLGGTVRSNVLRNLAWTGISALQFPDSGPIANVTIQRNSIEEFLTAYGAAGPGAIEIGSSYSGTPLQSLTVRDNFIGTGASAAIRVANVSGASVNGNTTLNAAISTGSSSGVNADGNLIDTTAAAALVFSGVSASNEAVAPSSWAKITGAKLAATADTAVTDPLPSDFDGVRVAITDSAAAVHLAPILFVSPSQINFLVPGDCAQGEASVAILNGDATIARAAMFIDTIAPALFTADGSGAGDALGQALLFRADGTSSFAPLTQPVDMGDASDSALLVLFATGLRNGSSAVAFFNSDRVPVPFAGDQGTFAGLDQVNIPIPAKYRGAGAVAVRLVVDGVSSNVVGIRIK
jgi:uncharacterized protein (TIGR03437 family)